MDNCKGININKAFVFNMYGFIPSVSESSIINTNFSIVYFFIILFELLLIFIYFKYLRGNSNVLLNN